jgi:Putative zinc-finger
MLMDHAEVVRLKAIEKYALGELPKGLREQFEEHYFDCPECANDVKTLATLVTAGRMVFEEEGSARVAPGSVRTEQPSWFSWLRPVVVVPVFTVMAATILFQNAITIPALKERTAGDPGVQLYQSSYRVQGATRGETTSKVTRRPEESFGLDFDFTPSESFPAYQGSLVDAAGKTVLTFRVKGEEANRELHLAVPGGKVHAGSYALVFAGEALTGTSGNTLEVQRLAFEVEDRP